ncbi:MAG: metallophosphoesterase [Phycisphaerae bacterium]|nr:metallophosphoesterase [Phycisphaerae bacterium]
MRILVTADLHYDIRRSRSSVETLAERVCRTDADAIMLVGDTAGAEHQPLQDCLGLFADFTGRKFIVPGNHCLWCLPGENSIQRYEQIIPAIAAKAGFAVLDHEPAIIDGLGLVGSVGWYDYSYRDEALGIPLAFYRAKVSPGAAARFGEYRELIEEFREQLSDRHFDITVRWMDGLRMQMEMSDEEFLDYVLGRLRGQLAAFEEDSQIRQVVAFVHHLPFRQLVPTGRPAKFTFAAAYLGSDKIGDTLRTCPKVTHVFCGHSHWPGKCRIGKIDVVNIGSTYTHKNLEVLDL